MTDETEHPDPEARSSEPRPPTDHERMEPAGPGSLADRGPLIDEDGDDIRLYTGEPVETEEGWVVPVQQNAAGKDNIAGGGEWPDPNTAPAQPQAPERSGGTR